MEATYRSKYAVCGGWIEEGDKIKKRKSGYMKTVKESNNG